MDSPRERETMNDRTPTLVTILAVILIVLAILWLVGVRVNVT